MLGRGVVSGVGREVVAMGFGCAWRCTAWSGEGVIHCY
jgi:hypothetical protein